MKVQVIGDSSPCQYLASTKGLQLAEAIFRDQKLSFHLEGLDFCSVGNQISVKAQDLLSKGLSQGMHGKLGLYMKIGKAPNQAMYDHHVSHICWP